jgi:hypothetical protein
LGIAEQAIAATFQVSVREEEAELFKSGSIYPDIGFSLISNYFYSLCLSPQWRLIFSRKVKQPILKA